MPIKVIINVTKAAISKHIWKFWAIIQTTASNHHLSRPQEAKQRQTHFTLSIQAYRNAFILSS